MDIREDGGMDRQTKPLTNRISHNILLHRLRTISYFVGFAHSLNQDTFRTSALRLIGLFLFCTYIVADIWYLLNL